MTEIEIAVEKDEESERAIPTAWRGIFSNIVEAFSKKDYSLSIGGEGVSFISDETANHIREYIHDYGEKLIPLPEETWESSVCIWMGTHWDVLIDLWTQGEGRSDLVLGAQVSEQGNGYIIEVDMVYVP